MKMLSRVALVLAAVAGAAALVALPAGASHSWGNYHWARAGNPPNLRVVDSVTSPWNTHLDVAISDWSKSNVVELQEEQGSEGRDRRQCKPLSGRIRVCNYAYGPNGWLGVAQIWTSGDHITQGTSKMNDSYFNSPSYNTPVWRQLVICQEPGHNLGLAHQDENFYNPNLGSCMDYTADPDGPPSNEHPNQHDYDQLEAIYAHLDSAASGPPSPGQAGPMRRAGNSDSLWVQELGAGRKLFTWVLWADPTKRHGPPDTG